MLTQTQKKQLKAKAHSLKPVVTLGVKGFTENVLNEIEIALSAHELVKVKLAGIERDERVVLSNEIVAAVGADLIQNIGSIAIIYRENSEDRK